MATLNQNVGLHQNLNPTIELIGDWDKANALLNGQLQLAVAIGAKKGQLAAAKKIQALVKKNIRLQSAGSGSWREFSTAYAKRKAKSGYGDDKWKSTGQYYRNIKVMDRGLNVFVGVPRGIKGKVNKNKPLNLTSIANILERGSAANNIQARPLWKPTLREFGGKARIAYHINYHIREQIYLATGLRNIKLR